MRKIFSLVLTLLLLCFSLAAHAAKVTESKWGVNNNNVLRLVLSLSEPAPYKVEVEDKLLRVTVDAAPSGNAQGRWSVRSSLANTMTVKKTGDKSVLEVPLTKSIGAGDVKAFTLKKDVQAKRPYRVVVDVTADQTAAVKTASAPVVSSRPVKKTVNSGSTWTPRETATSSGSWADRFNKNGTSAQKQSAQERVREAIKHSKQGSVPQSADVKPADNSGSTQNKVNEQQSSLKKHLSAKKAARGSDKKKTAKISAQPAQTSKNGVTTTVVDGLTIIKGSGKYQTGGGLAGKIITIDAGHGGSDPGAIGSTGLQEKQVTLPIALKLQELLTKAGAQVFMTRTRDVDVHSRNASDKAELQARVNVAEKNNSDAFISIHINASVNKNVSGLSTYYFPKTGNDTRLARDIQGRLTSNFGMNDLGIREANFYVIKRSSMPAALLELGFISNKKEETLLASGWFQNKAAQAICEGLKKYFS